MVKCQSVKLNWEILKIKTNERTFYFSLSDDKKQEWKKFIADRKAKSIDFMSFDINVG